MTSNRKLTAAEAHAWGLVSEVVEADGFAARAAELAADYAELPTRAIGMTKRLFDHAYNASLDEQLELEAELQQDATARPTSPKASRRFSRSARRASAGASPERSQDLVFLGETALLCFEKTSLPSESTSNWLFAPSTTDASTPLSFSTAARLVARRS